MPAIAGNDFVLSVGTGSLPYTYTEFAGISSTSVSFGSDAIEITNIGSDNWKEVLNNGGTKSVSISGSGFAIYGPEFATVEDNWDSQTLTPFKIVAGATPERTITGLFKITSFEYSGGVGEAVGFSISLESSGAITVTRPA